MQYSLSSSGWLHLEIICLHRHLVYSQRPRNIIFESGSTIPIQFNRKHSPLWVDNAFGAWQINHCTRAPHNSSEEAFWGTSWFIRRNFLGFLWQRQWGIHSVYWHNLYRVYNCLCYHAERVPWSNFSRALFLVFLQFPNYDKRSVTSARTAGT